MLLHPEVPKILQGVNGVRRSRLVVPQGHLGGLTPNNVGARGD
jgi:hypothetical protein